MATTRSPGENPGTDLAVERRHISAAIADLKRSRRLLEARRLLEVSINGAPT